MAIAGIDVIWGGCNGLDAFERSIYQGTQHFDGLQNPHLVSSIDRPSPQDQLMEQVADRALKDAGLEPGGKVAVMIALDNSPDSPPSHRTPEHRVAQHIAAAWQFTGPAFTVSAGENSVFRAMEVAQMLLATHQVEAVLLGAVNLLGGDQPPLSQTSGTPTLSYDRHANGWLPGEGAGAVVLLPYPTLMGGIARTSDRIYAVINSIALSSQLACPSPSLAATVIQTCQQAFKLAGIQPQEISYLEVSGSSIPQDDHGEQQGLIEAYRTGQPELYCAIGSVKTNIGHTGVASGIASLVKTALCLYHRYLPVVPQWTAPKQPQDWQSSPFYVPPESRSWLLSPGSLCRFAAMNGMGADGTCAHVILSEDLTQPERPSQYLAQTPFYLLPLAGENLSDLLAQLQSLQQTVTASTALSTLASQTYRAFQQREHTPYTLVILGHNPEELTREIQRAIPGVTKAFEQGKEWKTPLGSYFTAKPLGKEGAIAYVYPAAFSAYLGIGRDLFRLFPQLHNHPILRNVDSQLAQKVYQFLFPRSLTALTRRQLESMEQQLLDNIVAMLEAEIAYASFYTTVLKDFFQVPAHYAFGYSLGEISMMFAQGFWTDFNQGSTALNVSPLFKTRLAGSKDAVREYWQLPTAPDSPDTDLWGNYVLMAPVTEVVEYLKLEQRVYLTQINTPKEVVIAGDPSGCQRVIAALKCDAFRSPFHHAIHCDAMRSEYPELVRITTLPLQARPNTTVYAGATYNPVPIEQDAIAHSIAQGLCQPLDFPRLVNRVYGEGARIFIEAGAGSMCSRWIGTTLKEQEHLVVSLNQRGFDDHTVIVRALAKLLGHRVPMDVSSLYSPLMEGAGLSAALPTQPLSAGLKAEVHLSGLDSGLSPLKWTSAMSQEIDFLADGRVSIDERIPTSERVIVGVGASSNDPQPPATSIENSPTSPVTATLWSTTQVDNHQVLSSMLSNPNPGNSHHPAEDLYQSQCQKLRETHTHLTQIHKTFLQTRQDSLQHINQMIQLQIACSEQVLQGSNSTNVDSGAIASKSRPDPT